MELKKLSIIIPAYNEEKTIKDILAQVLRQDILGLEKEIIIVDDGSKDRTKEIIRDIIQKNPKEKIVLIPMPKNNGKGVAIRRGLQESEGDIILIQDADLEYDPRDYPKLLKPILNKETHVVYGSRLLGHHINMYWLHWVGSKFLNLSTNILYGSRLTDMETCYKMFRREVISGMNLRAKGFELEPEITSKILKRRYKIKEVPIRFDNPRTFKEGKKINVMDGIKAAYYLMKYRFFD